MVVQKTKFWFVLLILSFINTNVSLAEFRTRIELNSPSFSDHSDRLELERIYRKGWHYLAGKIDSVDYYLAYQHISEAAKGGHLKAQANLGAMYEMGLGMSKDYEAAFKWYRDAAMGGLAEAQYNLGNLYYHGLGVDLSNKLAIYWFSKAADQQHAKSELMLAAAYFLGRGVDRSTHHALQWAKRSSRHHLAEASHALGLAYKHGVGVAESSELAIHNFYIAAGAYLKRANRIKALEMLNLIRETTPTHPLYFQLKSTLHPRTSRTRKSQTRSSRKVK